MRICPDCQQALRGGELEGLCPSCLAKVALGSDAEEANSTQAKAVSSTKTLAIGPEAFARVRYFGDYELLEEIARGGMGVVWKARQAGLNRMVAVKMILAGQLAGEAEVQRFRREAEAAANLQHPNIVAIHEVGEHEGQHYYSMDYVAGRDLGAVVREGGPLAPAMAAEMLQTIAEAVHYAHQRGTLHRDLKPQNVLMDAAGRPRITDFGLAKFIERDDGLTQSGTAMGSPSYMPPEQAAGRLDQVGPASDVYALGAILYEVLTGRPPFRAETPMATLRQVMETDPVAPRKLNPLVPPDLENICLKCLEKNPARRYHSARALAEDLGRFLKHEPIQAHPVSAVRKAESRLRRHPWTLIAAGSLLIMGLSGTLYWQHEEVRFLEHRMSFPGQPMLVQGSPVQEDGFFQVIFFVYMATAIAHRIFRRFGQGITNWRKLLDRPTEWAPPRPVSPSFRIVCGVIALAGLVIEAVYFQRLIQESVWTNSTRWPQWLVVYAAFILSVLLLVEVLRDFHKFVHGTPHRPVPPEADQDLRSAIFAGDIRGALKLYRQSVPGVTRDEAKAFVARLAAELRTKEPGKFAPARPWWDMNWRAMSLVAGLEMGAVAGYWFFHPLWREGPAMQAIDLLWLAAGYLPGGVLFLGARIPKFWQRFLILNLGGMLPILMAIKFHANLFFLAGLAFGVLMMAAGRWHGRRSARTPAMLINPN